jgi:hypothetical protein
LGAGYEYLVLVRWSLAVVVEKLDAIRTHRSTVPAACHCGNPWYWLDGSLERTESM